jgi:hypothetical protein
MEVSTVDRRPPHLRPFYHARFTLKLPPPPLPETYTALSCDRLRESSWCRCSPTSFCVCWITLPPHGTQILNKKNLTFVIWILKMYFVQFIFVLNMFLFVNKCLWRHVMPITVAAPSEVSVYSFCVYVVYVGIGLATAWSPSKESYRLCIELRNWKSDHGPKGCSAIERERGGGGKRQVISVLITFLNFLVSPSNSRI